MPTLVLRLLPMPPPPPPPPAPQLSIRLRLLPFAGACWSVSSNHRYRPRGASTTLQRSPRKILRHCRSLSTFFSVETSSPLTFFGLPVFLPPRARHTSPSGAVPVGLEEVEDLDLDENFIEGYEQKGDWMVSLLSLLVHGCPGLTLLCPVSSFLHGLPAWTFPSLGCRRRCGKRSRIKQMAWRRPLI